MASDTVRRDRDGGIVTLTVDRVDAHNALNVQTLEELSEHLSTLQEERPDVLILAGAGNDAFIAGADIAYMQDLTTEEAADWAALGHRVANQLEAFPAPTIAAIDGYAFGGGNELALACDLRVASDTALMGQTEIDLGIIPGWGGTQRLPRIVGDEMARRMIYLGERLDAEEAHAAGLVGEVVPAADFDDRIQELAEELAAKPSFALASAKEALNHARDGDLDSGLALEQRSFTSLFGTPDQQEGVEAFLENRSPEFE